MQWATGLRASSYTLINVNDGTECGGSIHQKVCEDLDTSVNLLRHQVPTALTLALSISWIPLLPFLQESTALVKSEWATQGL